MAISLASTARWRMTLLAACSVALVLDACGGSSPPRGDASGAAGENGSGDAGPGPSDDGGSEGAAAAGAGASAASGRGGGGGSGSGGTSSQCQGLECTCADLARRGEDPPDAISATCADLIGRSCCEQDEVCLTGVGSTLCVARPADCTELRCACFSSDPCRAAARGVCAVPHGPPDLSRRLICQPQ